MSRGTVGDRVSRLRSERGLTQRDLAGPGVSYAYVSRIERGEREPSVKALRVLAAKLGTTPEYLETGRRDVTTLMLDDYAPFLEQYGLSSSRLTHEDVERLAHLTHEALKQFPHANPLFKAAAALHKDIEARKDPARHLS